MTEYIDVNKSAWSCNASRIGRFFIQKTQKAFVFQLLTVGLCQRKSWKNHQNRFVDIDFFDRKLFESIFMIVYQHNIMGKIQLDHLDKVRTVFLTKIFFVNKKGLIYIHMKRFYFHQWKNNYRWEKKRPPGSGRIPMDLGPPKPSLSLGTVSKSRTWGSGSIWVLFVQWNGELACLNNDLCCLPPRLFLEMVF